MRHIRLVFEQGFANHCFAALLVVGASFLFTAEAVELNEGDILVINRTERTLIAIDPTAPVGENQTVIVPPGNFSEPFDVEVEPDGGILVSDRFDDQIYRVDPATGGITPVITSVNGVEGLAVSVFGEIFVPLSVSFPDVPEILQVDPATGDDRSVTEGGSLDNPVDVVVEANGDLLVIDPFAGGSEIVRVDRAFGGQTVVATDGGAIGEGIALESAGTIVVASSQAGAVVRINPDTGDQTVLTAPTVLVSPVDVAVDADGSIIVTDGFYEIVARVDPVTGDATMIASDGFLGEPGGVAVYRTGIPVYECSGFAAPANAGPITVTTEGSLILRAIILDASGNVVGNVQIASAPAIQVAYEARPSLATPTDVTGVGPTPVFQGNTFIFRPASSQWLHGQQTGELSAPGVYTLSMVSGDWSQYRIKPTCEVTFVRE